MTDHRMTGPGHARAAVQAAADYSETPFESSREIAFQSGMLHAALAANALLADLFDALIHGNATGGAPTPLDLRAREWCAVTDPTGEG
jgi:hypothetical protein